MVDSAAAREAATGRLANCHGNKMAEEVHPSLLNGQIVFQTDFFSQVKREATEEKHVASGQKESGLDELVGVTSHTD